MDCEKFDQHVIDALYDELDELTHVALKRHVEGCSRCAGIYAGLRATREVGVLPIEEPPDDLEDKILGAVTVAQKSVPLHKKVLRALAWAGSHAMRPQLAMAALFFLVIGSSLLLLRARPGTLGPVRVTENGAPAAEAPVPAAAEVDRGGPQQVAAATAAATASPADGVPGGLPAAAAAPTAYGAAESKAKSDGAENEAVKPVESGADARAALAQAVALVETSGCAAAVSKLDEVAVRFAGTQAASDAMWAEATCFKKMGDRARAQQLFMALRSTGYRDRAQAELAEDANSNLQNQIANRAPPAAAPAPQPSALADADRARNAEAAGAGAPASRATKRSAAPAAPNSKARPAPRRDAAGFGP